jgi:hypothetical protein
MTSEGDWMSASLCSLGGTGMLVGRNAGVEAWAQSLTANGEILGASIELAPDDGASVLGRCSSGTAFAAGKEWVRRFDESDGKWDALHSFAPGVTYDLAVSTGGTALAVRGVDYDDGNTYRYFGLAVEHFE